MYIGKILKDEETVATYKIEEKAYVVCMVSKVCVVFNFDSTFELLIKPLTA